jgi:hypothetical protein
MMEPDMVEKKETDATEASTADEDVEVKTSGGHQSTPETSEKKKKVGSYILGKTLGEGSFAKVRQGIHLIAHEKVRSTCECPWGYNVNLLELTNVSEKLFFLFLNDD